MTTSRSSRSCGPSPLDLHLPAELHRGVAAMVQDWGERDGVARLWRRDPSLWTGADEEAWLGWLGIAGEQRARIDRFTRLTEDVRRAGFTHALLLGMGGSSLCADVLAMTFGRLDGFPALLVLDSTDPAQVNSFEKRIDIPRTLFIVSSKSGSTLEPNILKDYFFERASAAAGDGGAGAQFIAITDPGSKLEAVARSDRFRHIFAGVPTIGGRYSALSDFGLIPAAVMGLDVGRLLDRAIAMVDACGPAVAAAENPGLILGSALGVGARTGRDKVTLLASPRIRGLGAWLEQLLAESTGKSGRALIPVDGERLAPPGAYGPDRLFAYLRLASDPDEEQDTAVMRLQEAGHAVIRIDVGDAYDLGQEFFRWEIATAVAGSILGINPFDQPDVEASKVATRELTAAFEKTGALPDEEPVAEGEGMRLFTDRGNLEALTQSSGGRTVAALIGAHLCRLSAGDYFALLAWVERRDDHEAALQAIRHAVRDAFGVATCLGYGPRFLHSTGQAHKGGPDSGVFLQVTCDDVLDRPVPGRGFSFGVVKAAQARGDFQVLAGRGRRALRVHLGADVASGLDRLHAIIGRSFGH